MRRILASASPRRKELLGEIWDRFEILPATKEEKAEEGDVESFVKSLATAKAEEVFDRLQDPTAFVLGADTVVVLDGKVLGKPRSEEEAKRMLFALSGKEHTVLTGVCFCFMQEGEKKRYARAEKTSVFFRSLTESFVEEYVKSGSPMDKAGAYGIQDGGLVERIEGSYSNVVGLPLGLCRSMIEEIEEGKKYD